MDDDLILARAVFAAYEWEHKAAWNCIRCGTGKNSITFDPEGKHLPEVMCWLMRNGLAKVSSVGVNYMHPRTAARWYETHENTAPSLAKAVHRAAVKVAVAQEKAAQSATGGA